MLEIVITNTDHLVEAIDLVMELGRYHAEQPIIELAWKFPEQKRRAQFPAFQISLWKTEENNLPAAHYLHCSLQSASS